MPQSNREFYAARAARSRALAEQADDPDLAVVHRDTADNYAELAKTAPDGEMTIPDSQV